jgi:hypothetical protein
MTLQESHDVTPCAKWRVKVERQLDQFSRLTRASKFLKWAACAYLAQALAGFAVGLSIPWIALFTK